MDSEKRLRNWAKFWEKEDAAVAFDLKAGADALTRVKRVHEVVRTLDRLDDEAWSRFKKEGELCAQDESIAYENAVNLLNEALNGHLPNLDVKEES